MKILYLNINMHYKNHHALMNYKNIEFTTIHSVQQIQNIDLSKFNAVYSPSQPIDVSLYPNTKFIFGPHFSVFPVKHQIDLIKNNNSVYIQPSEWVVQLWQNNILCDKLKIKSLPFGVDLNTFNEIKPIKERNEVFLYYKTRFPKELILMEQFLKIKNINYKIFNYDTKYNENEFINYLKNSKYGIWVGRHESQGFALEEALSCNIPLLVWNTKSMNQEYRANYQDISATTIPYWDTKCGEYFYNIEELEEKFNLFLSKIETYKPREYILENLSFEVCEKQLMNLL
jgi:glycosyltransferase involved in cell wall biosynthesis